MNTENKPIVETPVVVPQVVQQQQGVPITLIETDRIEPEKLQKILKMLSRRNAELYRRLA